MNSQDSPAPPAGKTGGPGAFWGGPAIGVAFLVLAAWFLWGGYGGSLPPPGSPVVVVAPDARPLRQPLRDPPVTRIGGFERHCMECHRLFPSAEETARRLTQHTHIRLDHGLNDRCFNCHDREDRNRLTLRGGTTILYAEAARLCAKCHGPTYRDWERGMHGRTNDYWDATRGVPRRLRCVECHDPHAPAFARMKPLPGPRTLRMGAGGPRRHQTAVGRLDPLLKWQHAARAAHGSAPPDPDSAADGAAQQGHEETD